MTPAFTTFEDEFTRIINRPDKYMPDPLAKPKRGRPVKKAHVEEVPSNS